MVLSKLGALIKIAAAIEELLKMGVESEHLDKALVDAIERFKREEKWGDYFKSDQEAATFFRRISEIFSPGSDDATHTATVSDVPVPTPSPVKDIPGEKRDIAENTEKVLACLSGRHYETVEQISLRLPAPLSVNLKDTLDILASKGYAKKILREDTLAWKRAVHQERKGRTRAGQAECILKVLQKRGGPMTDHELLIAVKQEYPKTFSGCTSLKTTLKYITKILRYPGIYRLTSAAGVRWRKSYTCTPPGQNVEPLSAPDPSECGSPSRPHTTLLEGNILDTLAKTRYISLEDLCGRLLSKYGASVSKNTVDQTLATLYNAGVIECKVYTDGKTVWKLPYSKDGAMRGASNWESKILSVLEVHREDVYIPAVQIAEEICLLYYDEVYPGIADSREKTRRVLGSVSTRLSKLSVLGKPVVCNRTIHPFGYKLA